MVEMYSGVPFDRLCIWSVWLSIDRDRGSVAIGDDWNVFARARAANKSRLFGSVKIRRPPEGCPI